MKKKLHNLIESIHDCIDTEYYYLSESEKSELFQDVIYNALQEALDVSALKNAKLRGLATPDLSRKGEIERFNRSAALMSKGMSPKARKERFAGKLVRVIAKLGYPEIAKELANKIGEIRYDTSLEG